MGWEGFTTFFTKVFESGTVAFSVEIFSKNGRSHDLISGRLEESEVGVGGLHFGWIFLDVYCN